MEMEMVGTSTRCLTDTFACEKASFANITSNAKTQSKEKLQKETGRWKKTSFFVRRKPSGKKIRIGYSCSGDQMIYDMKTFLENNFLICPLDCVTPFPNSTNFLTEFTVPFILFILLINNYEIECALVLNKCCKAGMIFDTNLNCVELPKDYPIKDFYWFPTNSIVDVTTLKVQKSRREFYLKLLEKAVVKFGKKPECDNSESDSTSFTDGKPLFNFLLYNDSEMRVHVSSNKTVHRFEGSHKFAVVEEDAGKNVTEGAGKDNEVRLRTFPITSVCVDAVLNTNLHRILICPCKSSVCIRKCCKDGQYYNVTAQKCSPLGEIAKRTQKWRPTFLQNDVVDQYYLLSDTFPSCENPLLLKLPDHAFKSCKRFNKESDNDFTIYSNGSVKVNKYKKPFEPHQYCGEVTWHENGKVYEQNLILCSGLKSSEETKSPAKSIIYGTVLIFGGICLLITVAVSLYLPELRRRMHNKIALSHNVSLMVGYFTWGVGQLSPALGSKGCMLIALIIQFTFLGSFFWLNVMCLDISMTFSSTRSLGGHSYVGDYKKFVYYCIYSWGCTTVLSVITIIMEFLPDVPYDFLKPGFACSCGFNTANASILIYFYGPMSVLLICNLVIFIFTTTKIMSVQRQTAILHKTDSNTTGGSSFQSDKQRYDPVQWLILYGKLFLLMGLTWITEIISWAVGGPDYYWYFSDILNLLRAVFIFILFVCKRPVIESLKRKLLHNSTREGCSKSLSDVNSMSTSLRDSRLRSSTSSNKRKESSKCEAEAHKLLLNQRTADNLQRNGNLEESTM